MIGQIKDLLRSLQKIEAFITTCQQSGEGNVFSRVYLWRGVSVQGPSPLDMFKPVKLGPHCARLCPMTKLVKLGSDCTAPPPPSPRHIKTLHYEAVEKRAVGVRLKCLLVDFSFNSMASFTSNTFILSIILSWSSTSVLACTKSSIVRRTIKRQSGKIISNN